MKTMKKGTRSGNSSRYAINTATSVSASREYTKDKKSPAKINKTSVKLCQILSKALDLPSCFIGDFKKGNNTGSNFKT